MAPGCVQTEEHAGRDLISIDHRRTYGQALQTNMAQARKTARENPHDPAPHYFLAKAYLLQHDLDAAEAEFKAILLLSPHSAGAYYELGRINARRGDHETALLQLNRAVELKPSFAIAHYALARLHEKLGRFEKAEIHQKAYSEALEAQKRANEKP